MASRAAADDESNDVLHPKLVRTTEDTGGVDDKPSVCLPRRKVLVETGGRLEGSVQDTPVNDLQLPNTAA